MTPLPHEGVKRDTDRLSEIRMLTFRRFAFLFVGVALTGCDGDSTGPDAVDLHFAAQSFETLGRNRMSTGDWSGATASRAAALALRSGLRPARVRIAVDGTPEDYWALEIEHAVAPDITESPVLHLPIVTRTIVAWRGRPAERVISVTLLSDSGTFAFARLETSQLPPPYPIYFGPAFGLMFERRGPVHVSIEGGARSTRQTIGAECPLPDRPAVMRVMDPVTAPTSCHFARFFTRFNMRVQEPRPPGAAPVPARSVSMDGQEVPGIRLEYPWVYTACPVCR